MSSQSLRARAAGTEVAQQQPAAEPSIGALIQQLRPEIARALPRHMDADRMARMALTVLRKEPKLARCTPESFMGALLTAAQLGLEPGVSGEAYLVPYGKECQFIVGYQGYAKLFWQHPLARHIDAQAVYERDEFDYAKGSHPYLTHKPARGERGAVTDYYAVASLTTGATEFVVLSPAEVRALRGGKAGGNGNIADPQHWMERKTALRQLFKLLPKSTELVQAIAADEGIRTDLREAAIEDVPRYPAAVEAAHVVEQERPVAPAASTTDEAEVAEPPFDPSLEPKDWDR